MFLRWDFIKVQKISHQPIRSQEFDAVGIITLQPFQGAEIRNRKYGLNPGHAYFLLVDNGTTERLPLDLVKFWAVVLEQLKGEHMYRGFSVFL